MAEITYILGAGASYESIPVVKTFNKRLVEFSEFLSEKGQSYNGVERVKFLEASEAITNLSKDFSSHQSFDTYFKKQFHCGNETINIGKRLLHLYFIWEHSLSSYKFKSKQILSETGFKKEAITDKRYDALIAGLLKPIKNRSETVCKINFITWNYDLNLLHSIKNFFYPFETYEKFMSRINKNQFYWDIDGQIRIINVNGYFYSSDFGECQSLYNTNANLIIEKKIFHSYYKEITIDDDADKLRFSWELDSEQSKKLASVLKKVVSSSSHLIVIGYTFPLYNRFIDLQYMDEDFFVSVVNREKKITIQNPMAKEIIEILEDMTSHRYKFEALKMHRESCDSFFIPSNIFIEKSNEFFPEILYR